MKSWLIAKKTAVKSLITVICVLSLVATGLTGCGSSQPDEVNTVSNTTGGDESGSVNETQQAQTNVQEEGAYKLPDFDVEEEKPVAVDVDENWPVEYLLASAGGGAFGEGGGYSSHDGFEVYAFTPENVKCGYDNTNGFSIKISDTGSEDWHIQLKKNGVKVENGKWYQVTFDAKSSVDRSIMFSMQRDGSKDEDWRSYSGNKTVKLGKEWKPYTIIFQMTDATDNKAVYNISMGSVGGNRIRQQHTVNIKNMQLEELEDTWLDRLSQGDNLLKNPNFEYDDIAWDASVVEPGAATVTFENGRAVFDISNVGTTDWHVQLKQDSIKLEQGYNYRLTFKASSTAARSINIGFMDNNYVHWYGGSLEALSAGAERTVAVEFYMDKASNNNACMFISMGKIENMNTPASVITLGEFRLEKLPGRPVSSSASSGGGGWSAPVSFLGNGWELSYWGGQVWQWREEEPGSYAIDILDTGSLDWHVQMQKKGIVLENGKRYRMSFEARSSVDRKISCAIQKDGTNDDVWTSYSGGSGQYQLYGIWQTFTTEFTMSSPTDRNAIYNISLGAVDREIRNGHTVYLRNLKLEEIPEEPIESGQVGDEMLIADKWIPNNKLNGNSITEDNGKFAASITDVGENDFDVQILWKDLTLEKGCTYEFKCNADFDNGERIIKVGVMQDGTYKWYGGADLSIDGTSKEYTFTFVAEDTISNGMLAISMGKIEGEETPTGTVHLSNVSLKKTSEKTEEPDEPDDPTKPIEGNILPELADGNGWALNLNKDDSTTPGVATIEYTEDGTVVIDISNVGNKAHSVQFAMELVDSLKLEEGAKYKVYCDVESSVARPISIMVQKKGGDWSPYAGKFNETLSANTKTTFTFPFTKESDGLDAVFAVNLGKADSGNTPDTGTITLSRIAIVKTEDAPEKPDVPKDNLLPELADGAGWYGVTPTYSDGTAVITIDNVGSNPWDVQFAHDLDLEKGAKYEVSCEVKSSVARKIIVGVQGKTSYGQYGTSGEEGVLSANDTKKITFTATKNDNDDAMIYFNLGKAQDAENQPIDTPTGTITLSNISVVKVADAPEQGDSGELIAGGEGNILQGMEPKLEGSQWNKAELKGTNIEVSALESGDPWDIILTFGQLPLETGKEYTVTCSIKSSVGRKVNIGVQGDSGGANYCGYAGNNKVLTADKWEPITLNVSGGEGGYSRPEFYLQVGYFGDADPTTTHTITICDILLVEKSDASPTSESSDEEINIFSSDAVIEASSLDSVAIEEETDEDVIDEEPEIKEEIQETTDEESEPEMEEEIQEESDEEQDLDEETPEDAPNDSVTPETVDTSLNEGSNDSDDSN